MSEFDKTPVTEIDLANFDEVFEGSEDKERDYEPIPDGKYQASVERVELLRTKQGDPKLQWKLRILGPKCQDRVVWRNNVIGTPENIAWLKKDLCTCGLRLKKLSELPANLERLLDIRLEVTKRSKGDYESIYINKRIATEKEAGETKPQSAAAKPSAKPGAKPQKELGKF